MLHLFLFRLLVWFFALSYQEKTAGGGGGGGGGM